MNNTWHLSLIPALLAACCMVSAHAAEPAEKVHEHKSVIALKTDNFELSETDISDLAVGESETIITDSGNTIDLLRTEDGVEIYVDGELLEMSHNTEGDLLAGHEGPHKTIEIVCTSEDDCDETVWVRDSGEASPGTDSGGDQLHVIKREITITCDHEEECAEHNVWISDDGENVIDLEEIEGDMHVIRLHEESEAIDGEVDSKVIVIKKKMQ